MEEILKKMEDMAALKDRKEKIQKKQKEFENSKAEIEKMYKESNLILTASPLKDIKKQYRKKNIHLCADGDMKKIEKIPGVLEAVKETGNNEYIIKIESEDIISKVFEVVKTLDNVTKFSVEEPTLNEIFISKVGEAYEK